jgi:hypothetical protein
MNQPVVNPSSAHDPVEQLPIPKPAVNSGPPTTGMNQLVAIENDNL